MSTIAEETMSVTGTPVASIHVYNTLTRHKEPFQTVVPGKVGMYLCGPTVYKEAHIGHMVGPVIFDTIKRYLVHSGYDVTWVVNITDVDDKLIAESQRRGIPMASVAEEMTEDYLQNLEALGVTQIDEMPRATEHMSGIIAFVSALIDKGFAYASEGDVYFEVARDDEYGKLSNRTAESQQGEGGDMASRKRAPGDFALWKSSKPGEPSWESPWGAGRPGWHIECSAMSRAILGEEFDIHGGGLDLIFPHHENEIAQSECCHGKPMARYWLHNGLMRASSAKGGAAAAKGKIGGRNDRDDQQTASDASGKISRSAGAGGLAQLIEAQSGERIRFFLLRTHYRSTIVFDDEGLAEAGTALASFQRFFERFERICGESFFTLSPATTRVAGSLVAGEDPLLQAVSQIRDTYLSRMDDDFNTGAAVSELFELLRVLNKYADEHQLEEASAAAARRQSFQTAVGTLKELTQILGLFQQPPHVDEAQDDGLVDPLMQLLIEIRNSARQNKDFATADRVRDALSELGITLEDRKGETLWRRDA